jgi:hypothetical protein
MSFRLRISEWQREKKWSQTTLYFLFLEWTMLRRGSNETDGQKKAWGFPPHAPDKRATLDPTIRHSRQEPNP